MVASIIVLPVSAAGANVVGNVKLSEYICDFEGNYHSSVAGSIVESENGEALRFKVDTSADNHCFEIHNTDKGDLTINNGNVYAVKIAFKVENISNKEVSDLMTSINLVRYNGNDKALVKIKTFPNATFNPGDTTGWVNATVVFKASIADSPEYNRLAINVVSPSCSKNSSGVVSEYTYIWFDDITVTECTSTTTSIDFQTNGGDYCDVLMAEAGAAITLPTPTRDLYDFVGWYSDANLTNKYTVEKMPSSLVTKVYAAWEVSATSIKVEFADAYDDNVSMLVGRAGDALTLPTPVRHDFHFAGWYLDEELTKKCSYTAFPDASVTLYAKWEVIPFFCDFEQKEAYGTPNDGTFTKRCEISDAEALRGNNALSYNYWKGSQTEKPTQWRAIAGVLLINEHGEKFRAVPGATYTITFNYKLNKVDVQGKGNILGSFGVVLASSGGAWSNRAVMVPGFADEAVNYEKKDVNGEWAKGTITFVANPKGASVDNAYVYLGIAGDAELVVDDLCIYQVDEKFSYDGKCVINFDSQGGNYCETVKGQFGETIVMPKDPVREGYRFMGWYTDSECNSLWRIEREIMRCRFLV